MLSSGMKRPDAYIEPDKSFILQVSQKLYIPVYFKNEILSLFNSCLKNIGSPARHYIT